ncbi:hypothetical protein GCM10010965_16160 [Caldalkalibacillus thermarum]|uniref:nucleotidyltransferase family protein n=1 Tax=Caldalkalibacillus thermarum TaxID=296745 RepID=UPI001664729F|nr:nucleotidyltransferase domain-containing protein [Caldalkalibacillus thermarum]GGK24163.1 hypothetical protein GCM10010965_16160 [Caldalkalibacillus thermarum]
MNGGNVASRDDILEQVYLIAKQHLNGLNVSLYLFGSWARGEERASSDIDIAVSYRDPLPAGTLAQLRLAFEESSIPYTVDLVDLTQTESEFREKVMKEGIKWSV